MATLNIEGRTVQVDDGFLKLSPEQQNATVDEIAASFKAQPSKPGVAEDVARSAGIGVVKGGIGTIGAAGDVRDLASAGADYLGEKAGVSPERMAQVKGVVSQLAPMLPGGRVVMDAPTSHGIQSKIEETTGKFYKPQTVAGEYAQTAGEFLPAAFGGEAGLVARGLRVLVPAATSETAGQLTKGTRAEPVARFLGALAGGGATALASRPGTAARSIANQLPEGITEPMVVQADRLMQDAAQRGVQLVWPEALSQVAGRPVLTNMMRHLEASPQTEGQVGAFFAERPQQVERATRQELGNIAPVNDAPTTIGPAVGQAAERTIRDVEKLRTRTVDPYYRAADKEHVPGPVIKEFVDNLDSAIASDKTGIVGGSLKEIRRLLVEKPAQAEIPAKRTARDTPNGKIYDVKPGSPAVPEQYITDIENLDRVRKYVRDKMEMPQIGQDAITKEQGKGIITALDDLEGRMVNASKNFETGKAVYQDITEKYVKPLMDGYLGKLAGKDTTTEKAVNVLFKQPLANSEKEIATAVSAVAQRNPRAARDIVRTHAEITFNKAAKDLQTGPNQANGAKFRTALVGDSQQEKNLKAAVEALPNGDERWQGFNRLLDVLEATGTRQGIGSRTTYNQMVNDAQKAGGLVSAGAKVASNPMRFLQPVADKYDQWKLGRNLGQLATILTDPNAAGMLRAIARAPREGRRSTELAVKLVTYGEASRQTENRSQQNGRQ